jgi:hypothetical protein
MNNRVKTVLGRVRDQEGTVSFIGRVVNDEQEVSNNIAEKSDIKA